RGSIVLSRGTASPPLSGALRASGCGSERTSKSLITTGITSNPSAERQRRAGGAAERCVQSATGWRSDSDACRRRRSAERRADAGVERSADADAGADVQVDE